MAETLFNLVVQRIAEGKAKAHSKQTADTFSWDKYEYLAEDDIRNMDNVEFLQRLSDAIDEMFPVESGDDGMTDEERNATIHGPGGQR